MSIETLLKQGIAELDLTVADKSIAQLVKFAELLKKWNKVYNLTALKTDEEIVTLHLLDSLTVLPYARESKRVIDVGSGAGIPGIPLAILLPETKFVLLDSNGKKTRFIQQAIIDLGLTNCSVQNKRIEDYTPEQPFDVIITRAFAEIKDTIVKLKHFTSQQFRLLMMKSKNVENELKELSETYQKQCIKLRVPGLEAERYLVIVTRH